MRPSDPAPRLAPPGPERPGDGFGPLAGLKALHTLTLSNAQVTDGALPALRGNDLLHVYCQAYGKSFSPARSAAEIERLYLHDTAITDTGLKKVAGLESLRLLGVRGTKVTDAGGDPRIDRSGV